MTEEDVKAKNFHILAMCATLIDYCLVSLKDTNLYKLKTKKLLNLLLKENKEYILEHNRIKELIQTENISLEKYREACKDASLSREDLIEDITTPQHIVYLFVNLFYKLGDNSFISLLSILNSFNKGERVLNKRDLLVYNTKMLKELYNMKEVDAEKLQEYLNKTL